ncbi:MAG: hypothetical protein M3008_05260 [Chloroflexota bacterium]|nr:hypothetical protein [Chloroflexota bacterium]
MRSITPVEDNAIVKRALALMGEFMRQIVANPAIAPTIPDGATIILLPDNDPELAAYNTRLGMHAIDSGANAYFLHVEMTGARGIVASGEQSATIKSP